MHIHAQIVSFVHLLNVISCSWCKYLLQSLFETQLITAVLILFVFFLSSRLFLSFCLFIILSFCHSLFFCLYVLPSYCLSVVFSFCLSVFVLLSSSYSTSEVVLIFLESYCAFWAVVEQKVNRSGWDGMGWMVIMGRWSSKSIFGANNVKEIKISLC